MIATYEVWISSLYGGVGLGLQGVNVGVEMTGRDQGMAYPVAAPLPHLISMALHWAVVGFGNGTVGSFQLKEKD